MPKRTPKLKVRQEWRALMPGRRLSFWAAVSKQAKAQGIASTDTARVLAIARRHSR